MTENRHLAKARGYLEKGDGFYAKAADEMIAAQAEGLGRREIARTLGRSTGWVGTLIRWRESSPDESGIARPTPYSGKEIADRQDTAKTKKVLRQSTPEQVEAVLADLPDKQVEAVQLAATKARVAKAGGRKPPKVIGKPIAEPRQPGLAYAEASGYAIDAEAGAEKAMTLARSGDLDDRAENLRELALGAADAWRAVASEMASRAKAVAV